MRKQIFQLGWLFSLVFAATLACSSIDQIGNEIGDARGTAGAAATDLQGLATMAEGLATSIGGSDLVKTAQAFATEQGPELMATGQALATKAAESNLASTLAVVSTEGINLNDVPADIPVIENDKRVMIIATSSLVSYQVELSLAEVNTFYSEQMALNGWTLSSEGTPVPETLVFKKDNRTANIQLTEPVSGQSIIIIWITEE